jgi:hypothetical protein
VFGENNIPLTNEPNLSQNSIQPAGYHHLANVKTILGIGSRVSLPRGLSYQLTFEARLMTAWFEPEELLK